MSEPSRVRCIRLIDNQGEILGSVDWEEFAKAHAAYIEHNKRRKTFQLLSAVRLAELGGFGYDAYKALLGHIPETWTREP